MGVNMEKPYPIWGTMRAYLLDIQEKVPGGLDIQEKVPKRQPRIGGRNVSWKLEGITREWH